MQIASWAILLNTSPPGSEGFGSRDEFPIVTLPAATSATPMSEPPWSSLKLTQWSQTWRYLRASSAASGARDVDPLIVMVGLAAAVAGATTGAAATSARAERSPALRSRSLIDVTPFEWICRQGL